VQTLKRIPRSAPLVLALVAALLIGATSGAVAAKKITGKDIALNTITGANVKAGSLAASDLSAAAKATLKGNRGPAGPRGNPGAPGAGFDDFSWYQDSVANIPAGTNSDVISVLCPQGQSIVDATAFWEVSNEPLVVSVGFTDTGDTMGAIAYTSGIDTAETVYMQYSCATLPLPEMGARKALPGLIGARSVR
jgi:hypothetical protein